MLYFYLLYTILIIIINIYFKKKKILSNYTGDHHQLFSNKKNIPLVGGLFLIAPIILINYENYIYSTLIIFTSLIGIFSDTKIMASPKKRFLFQLTLIFFSVIFLNLEILSSRIIFFDSLLEEKIFNILFTSFCMLVLLNGSNFIDGLNGLLITYVTIVIIVLSKLNLISGFLLYEDQIKYLIFFLLILNILNFCNLLMLGDTGAYILSFFVGFLIISCHKVNPYISPYFFITLIWYPCFENLFSIIRKLYLSLSPFTPDNNHLHQLFFNFINTKIFKSKIVSNNLSSVIINFFNFIILYTAAINPYNTIYQIKLISFSIVCYILAFFLLKNKINKF